MKKYQVPEHLKAKFERHCHNLSYGDCINSYHRIGSFFRYEDDGGTVNYFIDFKAINKPIEELVDYIYKEQLNDENKLVAIFIDFKTAEILVG